MLPDKTGALLRQCQPTAASKPGTCCRWPHLRAAVQSAIKPCSVEHTQTWLIGRREIRLVCPGRGLTHPPPKRRYAGAKCSHAAANSTSNNSPTEKRPITRGMGRSNTSESTATAAKPAGRGWRYGMLPMILRISCSEKPRRVCVRVLPSEPTFNSREVAASSSPSTISTRS